MRSSGAETVFIIIIFSIFIIFIIFIIVIIVVIIILSLLYLVEDLDAVERRGDCLSDDAGSGSG